MEIGTNEGAQTSKLDSTLSGRRLAAMAGGAGGPWGPFGGGWVGTVKKENVAGRGMGQEMIPWARDG